MGGVFATILRTATVSMSTYLLHANPRVMGCSLNSGPVSCVPSDSQYDKILISLTWVFLSLLLLLVSTILLFAYIHRRFKTSVNAKDSSCKSKMNKSNKYLVITIFLVINPNMK